MKSKTNKIKLIIIIVAIVFILALIVLLGLFILQDNKNPYGDRCDERINYEISNKQIKKVKNKFKEIEEVKDIDVYTKLCTIKIIVNLKNDVELDIIKTKAEEALTLFSEEELNFYDFALYVTSDNKDSEIYPINVSKHNSRDGFAW